MFKHDVKMLFKQILKEETVADFRFPPSFVDRDADALLLEMLMLGFIAIYYDPHEKLFRLIVSPLGKNFITPE